MCYYFNNNNYYYYSSDLLCQKIKIIKNQKSLLLRSKLNLLDGKSKKSSSNEQKELNQIAMSTSNPKKKYMEDYEIIGQIEIPKIDLKCNILNETTKRALEIAVTKIYTTSDLNLPGNTVIYGHNYRNALFFSRNDELENGDKLYITDTEGNKVKYEIYNIFETTSADTSFYARSAADTGGKAEVTLSTCTDDASQTDRRLIVQAKAE